VVEENKPDPGCVTGCLYVFVVFPFWYFPKFFWRLPWTWLSRWHLRWLLALAPWAVLILALVRPDLFASQLEWLNEFWSSENLAHTAIPLTFGFCVVLATIFLGPIYGPASTVGRRRRAISHGSSEWGGLDDAKKSGAAHLASSKTPPQPGQMLGRFSKGHIYRTSGHVLTIAPTGSGKGIGCVIPHLLTYPAPVFVLDVKGENYAVTHRRREEMGHTVHCIDPFAVTGAKPSPVNPLDLVDPLAPDSVARAAQLADALVLRSSGGDQHWDDSAAALIQGLLLHIAALPKEQKHLGTLRELLTLGTADLEALLEVMTMTDEGHGIVARAARAQLSRAEREASSVVSTAIRHTSWLDDPRVTASLKTGFPFDLKGGATTVYLVIPPELIRPMRGLVRAIVTGFVQAQMTPAKSELGPVVFLLDEVAQLGHLAVLEDGVAILRGYGCRLWMLVQDLSQLEAVYPRWRTFLANSALQAFGTQDLATCEHISKMLGQQTIEVQSASKSSQDGNPGSVSSNRSNLGRDLMTPDEVRRLEPSRVIIIKQGEPPYRLQRLNYLEDPETLTAYDANPYHS